MTTETDKHPNIPGYQSRLDAKKAKLESEIKERQMRLQNNVQYMAKNVPAIAVQEVTAVIKEKNPPVAKVLSLLGIGDSGRPSRVLTSSRTSGRFMDDTGDFDPDRVSPVSAQPKSTASRLIDVFEEWGLPIIATIGSQKLLSLTLGGSGTLVRKGLSSVLRGLFRRR